jgi:hypothetical protein
MPTSSFICDVVSLVEWLYHRQNIFCTPLHGFEKRPDPTPVSFVEFCT